MLTRDEAQKLANKVLGLATFPECHVTIAASEQAYTRFANNGITTASVNPIRSAMTDRPRGSARSASLLRD